MPRSACSSANRSARSSLFKTFLARMIENITASQCLIVRQAQLHAEGKLSDAHAALIEGVLHVQVP